MRESSVFCLSLQVAIAKAITSLQKYVTGGEGLKAIKTIRTLVNNALTVRGIALSALRCSLLRENKLCFRVRRCSQHPGEEKYSSIRLSNEVSCVASGMSTCSV